MKIITDYIRPGMRHRPMTNPASSLYRKTMKAKYITIHNAGSPGASAKQLHNYVKSQAAADRPASWHFSLDEVECYQSLPLTESGWHAGDNMGPGNTTTIGIEICDYAMYLKPADLRLFKESVDHTAKLCAWLIKEVPSLKPYPDCLRLRQHWDWSGKNCPYWIRRVPGWWEAFVEQVGEYLKVEDPLPEPDIPDPDVDRKWIDDHPELFRGDSDPYIHRKQLFLRRLWSKK